MSSSLSQGQIIRSLADALAWFEKEIEWNVEPAELRHLTGRIGELYAAMITRGQMALAVAQKGYDVVSAEGEHISVKTITSWHQVSLKRSTIGEVHRVMILRINVDEGEASIEEIFDGEKDQFLSLCIESPNEFQFFPRKFTTSGRSLEDLKIITQVERGRFSIKQYENGTVTVEADGQRQPARPILREIGQEIGVDPLNSNGNRRNTRQLGAAIIEALKSAG